MLPFKLSIAPIFWAVGIGAVMVGALWLVDEIGDRREAKVNARWEARDREIIDKARKEAEEAETARQPAFAPGALARLRAEWCRDCEEVR